MMFKKKPKSDSPEDELLTLRSRAVALSVKRRAADAALTEAMAIRQRHHIGGDLDDAAMAQALQDRVNAAASTVVGLDDAITAVAAQIKEIEQKLDADRLQAERAAAANKLRDQVAAVGLALPGYLEQTRVLAETLASVEWHFDSSRIKLFLQDAASQVESALRVALAELAAMPFAIEAGQQAIPGEPVAPLAPVPAPIPETKTVFMLRSARYFDLDGRKHFAGQWTDATMPVTAAQHALDMGVAVPLTDERRVKLRGVRGDNFNPNAPDVVDLTNNERGGYMTDPVLSNADFTVIDRSSEARTIEITVPRV